VVEYGSGEWNLSSPLPFPENQSKGGLYNMGKQERSSLWEKLYYGLCLIVSILMIVSFSLPWWSCTIQATKWVKIYGWGLTHNLVDLASSIAQDITPVYQIILAWVYLAVCVGIIALSAWKLNKKNNYLSILMLVIAGASYIAYAAIAGFMVIANRVEIFGINLTGQTLIKVNSWMTVINSKFDIGFYLAFAAGFLCMLLAVFRFFVAGKIRTGLQVQNDVTE
jgi:hypothetical protein